ncbi:GNAT family N-acetyltransferase [Streptomyces sp. JJ66]|uniref:GNAT family N-acetyltransferase n=1 Tax=Streptomyces sp. JJ66 TaxID=2803843 RepID=UPI001C59340A|nr:GNAT family N-acetyltransferase [Streptomyces sp. JJ66]MBW1603154.1 GNAT family N-acetyltransferase [Streptomyces sp. JJ66]
MRQISVRVVEPGEWRVYRDVRLAALGEAPYAFGSTLAREQAFTEERWRGRLEPRTTFVVERAGQVCGLAGVLPGERAELVSMWVAPQGRGSGAADALVGAALARAAELGARYVGLWVAEGNARAERLYARHGFERTGEAQLIRAGEVAREFAMIRPAPAEVSAG